MRAHVRPSQRRIETLILALRDGPGVAGPMSKEELDYHPVTKDLSDEDRQAIADHWPRWESEVAQYKELAEQRADASARAVKVIKKGAVMSAELELETVDLPRQFRAIVGVYGKQINRTALELKAINEEDIVTDADPQMKQMYKNRIGYLKDCLWVTNSLLDLADKFETMSDPVSDQDIPPDILAELERANLMLKAKGITVGKQGSEWQP